MSDQSDHWCRTTFGETKETTFSWTIEDFASRPEKKWERIQSSSFLAKTPDQKDSKWKSMLYPKGDKKGEGNLSIFLTSYNSFSIKAKFEVSILDSRSQKTSTWTNGIQVFDSSNPAWGNRTWSVPLTKNSGLLPKGHLSIHCVLTVYGTEKTLSGSGSRDLEIESKANDKGLQQISQHFGKLFNDKEFSDVEIECEGETFSCHKVILSTRSDIFKAMFQADMIENRTKKVLIEDIDSVVVKEMLYFIYTGATNEEFLKERSGELLAAAEKYNLDVLKNICEDYLCSTLEIGNVVDNLVLGDYHRASKLRKMSMTFIARNLAKVVKTVEYRNLVKSLPSLAAEILEALVEDKMK